MCDSSRNIFLGNLQFPRSCIPTPRRINLASLSLIDCQDLVVQDSVWLQLFASSKTSKSVSLRQDLQQPVAFVRPSYVTPPPNSLYLSLSLTDDEPSHSRVLPPDGGIEAQDSRELRSRGETKEDCTTTAFQTWAKGALLVRSCPHYAIGGKTSTTRRCRDISLGLSNLEERPGATPKGRISVLWRIGDCCLNEFLSYFDTRSANKQPLLTLTYLEFVVSYYVQALSARCVSPMFAYVIYNMFTLWYTMTCGAKLILREIHILEVLAEEKVDYTTTVMNFSLESSPIFNSRKSVLLGIVRIPPASSAVIKGWGKWQIPEKAREPVGSSGTILTCKNPGLTPPGFEPGSPMCEASKSNHYTTTGHQRECSRYHAALWPPLTADLNARGREQESSGGERPGRSGSGRVEEPADGPPASLAHIKGADDNVDGRGDDVERQHHVVPHVRHTLVWLLVDVEGGPERDVDDAYHHLFAATTKRNSGAALSGDGRWSTFHRGTVAERLGPTGPCSSRTGTAGSSPKLILMTSDTMAPMTHDSRQWLRTAAAYCWPGWLRFTSVSASESAAAVTWGPHTRSHRTWGTSHIDNTLLHPLRGGPASSDSVNVCIGLQVSHPSTQANARLTSAPEKQTDCSFSTPMGVIEVSMERRRNETVGETGVLRENSSTSSIVRYDSHMQKSGSDLGVVGTSLCPGDGTLRHVLGNEFERLTGVLHAKAGDDDVDEGYDEDEDEGQVVEDERGALVHLPVDVEAADDEEDDADADLRGSRTQQTQLVTANTTATH
ncbi:hypothetical protein PR048_008473 [Dryococelus australis]|uniref:Uncharacterized protein n=1 Tax=Dryococelus australis TaxID=614101 RepID=A0ABQ9HX82_9NEOP|nr:hypothetical protein PR048_008473 [Dryococelus australis]